MSIQNGIVDAPKAEDLLSDVETYVEKVIAEQEGEDEEVDLASDDEGEESEDSSAGDSADADSEGVEETSVGTVSFTKGEESFDIPEDAVVVVAADACVPLVVEAETAHCVPPRHVGAPPFVAVAELLSQIRR